MTWGKGNPRASTAEWKRTRLQVLERDGYRCRICGAPANEVDHITEWSDGGTDHPSNLRTLCTPHHRAKTAAHAASTRWAKQTTTRQPEQHPGLH